MSDINVEMRSNIVKRDDDQRIVYGWALVVEEHGRSVVDTQGHEISQDVMEKAAIGFMENHRVGGILHIKKSDGTAMKVAEVVASMPMTTQIQKAFGLDLGKAGWMIGLKVLDDGIWEMVKRGDLPAFSIGGSGVLTNAD